MARVREYTLVAEPQPVADNQDGVAARTYLLVNVTALASGELLGDGQALGEGIPIDANEKSSVDLPGGERLYAAAPDADAVVLRVLETRG